MNKKWAVAPKVTEEFQSRFPTLSGAVLQLLYNRKIETQEQIDEFLNPDYGQDIHDPFLFQDMAKAVERVFRAINGGEKVIIYGDYDADGMSASAVLFLTLKELGLRNVDVYIPERETEGYSLNSAAVEEFSRQGTNLIITVDCGISNKKEVELAKKLKIDVLITDHHQEPLELPDALALINPKLSREKYPFRDLAGVGVAFKFVQALIKKRSSDQAIKRSLEGFEKWLLDLVAVGTVADRMPLLGENRTLVKYGLVVLNKTRRVGLKELINEAGISLGNLDTHSIGYQIGPRLNAAGRINHSNSAYRLLIIDSKEEARQLAGELEQTNQKRQRIVEQITEQARLQVKENANKKEIIVAANLEKDAWPGGILGLVAGKLSEEFNRPALAIGQNSRRIVGSGRVPPWPDEFNITESLAKAGEYLNGFGGHAGACGFTLKSEEAFIGFKNKISEVSRVELENKDLSFSLFIDAEINLSDVNWPLYEDIGNFEPFGEDNERPKFLIKNLNIVNAEKVGQTGNHLRIMATDTLSEPATATATVNARQAGQGIIKKLIGFGIGNGWGERLKRGSKIDAVIELGVNEWNGNRELQMKIIDLKESESTDTH